MLNWTTKPSSSSTTKNAAFVLEIKYAIFLIYIYSVFHALSVETYVNWENSARNHVSDADVNETILKWILTALPFQALITTC